MGDDNDFVINTSDIIIKNKRYVRKIEHNKLDSYFENPDFFTLGKCNSDYTGLKMATSPDDNSGITKLDESPVPEEINNGVFLRGAFMCHNMTSAYNLNNYPRNYGRFYDSTKLGNLDGDILKHGLKRFITVKGHKEESSHTNAVWMRPASHIKRNTIRK